MSYVVSTDKREPPAQSRGQSSHQTLIWRLMIRLTRLNGSAIALNSDLIKFVENAPDTVITLINGEKIIVRESTDELMRKLVEFRRAILSGVHAVGADHSAAIAQSAPKPSASETRTAGGLRRG